MSRLIANIFLIFLEAMNAFSLSLKNLGVFIKIPLLNTQGDKMEFKIQDQWIGPNRPTYFIADIAANHDGDLDRAKMLIKLAKEAGADAIKLQTYTPDTITIDCDNEYFQIKQGTIWDGTTLYKLYQQAYTP